MLRAAMRWSPALDSPMHAQPGRRTTNCSFPCPEPCLILHACSCGCSLDELQLSCKLLCGPAWSMAETVVQDRTAARLHGVAGL